MEWIIKTLESAVWGIISLISNGLMTKGEQLGDALPNRRVMDKVKAQRRLKGDMAELHTLYTRLRKYESSAEETCNTLCRGVVLAVLDRTPDDLTNPVVQGAVELCRNLLGYDRYYPLPEIDFSEDLQFGKIWDLKALVTRCLAFYEKPEERDTIVRYLTFIVEHLCPAIPAHQEEEILGFLPVYASLSHFASCLEKLIGTAVKAGREEGIMPRLGETLFTNVLHVSGIDPREAEVTSKMPVFPSHMPGASPDELIASYLCGTPFAGFLTAEVIPFALPLEKRFAHMHIVGGSGHGKTQTLQNLFLADLGRVGRGDRSVVVIDSQGDLIHNILKLAAVGDILDRVVLIYPKDIKYPPALNLFDFGWDRLQRYTEVEQEMLLNGAVSLYEYMFGAVLGADLTAKQGVIFGWLARLLLVVPGATIDTLIDFLEEPETVRPFLAKLDDPLTRRFFQRQFFNKGFDNTRQEILYRIYDVLQIGTLARMFRNKRNKVNVFEAINRGSLILIHTAKDLLKQEGCEILGRFFIALIAQAAQERAALSVEERTPTFVYIDEAHDYFDENMENLLEQARKYRVGLILAHQHLDQFKGSLRSTVKTNTAIKMVGGLSAKDASELAADMASSPEFLLSMRKYQQQTEFACYVKDATTQAIRLSIPFGKLESQPKIHPQVFKALILRNRDRYCTNLTEENPPDEPDSPDDSPLGDPDLL